MISSLLEKWDASVLIKNGVKERILSKFQTAT